MVFNYVKRVTSGLGKVYSIGSSFNFKNSLGNPGMKRVHVFVSTFKVPYTHYTDKTYIDTLHDFKNGWVNFIIRYTHLST